MDVEIDISENLKKIDKDSFLGVCSTDGAYRRSVQLPSSVKKRIKRYQKLRDRIHVALIYFLIKYDLPNYSSIKICPDIGKTAIRNNLRSLLKDNKTYRTLESTRKIKVQPVGHNGCQVHTYVTKLKKKKLTATSRITLSQLRSILERYRHRRPVEILAEE